MMSLLKFTSSIVASLVLVGCFSGNVKTNVAANVESEEIEIPSQAATDFKLAIDFMNKSKPDEAKKAFTQMTVDYPTLSGPFANLGVIYSQENEWGKALEYLILAQSKNTKNVKILNQLGYVYRQQGMFSEAQSTYEKAIKTDANYADSYLNLGVLFDIYMGNLVKASNFYQKYQSLQSSPDRKVAGWIVDINRRAGIKTQVAGGQ
jgi:tetratricopeptide (TPR) repeat protein